LKVKSNDCKGAFIYAENANINFSSREPVNMETVK